MNASSTAPRRDVYRSVTDRIVADLEQGARPWQRPWDAEHPGARVMRPLRHNGEPYRGINVLMLWSAALDHGYASPTWMTFKQALDLGGCVRKGEKSSLVVYANTLSRTATDARTGEETDYDVHYLKSYAVFNVAQIEGLPERYRPVPTPRGEPVPRIARADAFFVSTGAELRHGGDRAYYAAGSDHIQMPPFESFRDAESYYATLAHETTHWTKHTKRLDRDLGRKRWGDEGYAMEELVAELGAAFLSADLELTPEPRADHSSYLASWLRVLKQDSCAIFAAAAHAQRAADYLNELQPGAGALPAP